MATAKTGDFLQLPGAVSVVVATAAADTGGDRIELEFALPPGGPGPPAHFHPAQEEQWHVLAGTFSVYLDGAWRSLTEGQSVSIPPGQVHTFRNRSEEPVKVRDVHLPALDFQDYMEDLHRLTQAGKLESLRSPSALIHLSMVLREHRSTQLTASAAQRAAESTLALAGRLLGYRIPGPREA